MTLMWQQLVMETKLAKLSNKIFLYVVIFLISFIWCNCYISRFFICVILANLTAIILCILVSKFSNKKENQLNQKKATQLQLTNTITQLLFMEKSEQLNYFYNVISFSFKQAKINKQYITLNNKLIFPVFNYELEVSDFLNIFNKHREKKLIILTNKLSKNLEDILSKFDLDHVKILCAEDVFYKIINPSQIFPTTKIKQKNPTKLKLKELLFVAFNKTNSKKYFYGGIILLFFSLIYKYTLYYQIMGTIMFLFSLFSRYNKKYNPNKNCDTLNPQNTTE